MKRMIEPIAATITGLISWTAIGNFMMTLLIAFMTGAIGFLGRYLAERAIKYFKQKKNV